MIKVDFSLAVALYLSICLGLLFCFWLLIKSRGFFEDFLSLRPRFIWCCSACTYTYFTTRRMKISLCPRCASYNSYNTEGRHGKDELKEARQ